ncbi:MAG: hypothetical protein Q9201_004275 [Fulgogasparrea decipioides]
MSQHSPVSFLALAGLAFFLISFLSLLQPEQGRVQNLISRQPSSEDQLLTTTVKSNAIPFGNHFYSHNFSDPSFYSPHDKRAPILNFNDVVCYGQAYWDEVQRVYQGRIPSRGMTFGHTGRIIEDHEINQTAMLQDQSYRSVGGSNELKAGGKYDISYIRSAAAIIANDIKSPLSMIIKEGIPFQQATSYISDMAWTVWSDILTRNDPANGPADTLAANQKYGPHDPGRLQHLGHDFVVNGDSKAIMQHVIRLHGDGTLELPWSGLTYGMDTNEGLALLGTPNGKGTARLLMDRFHDLGERKPTVTIWMAGNEKLLNMVWHLEDP